MGAARVRVRWGNVARALGVLAAAAALLAWPRGEPPGADEITAPARELAPEYAPSGRDLRGRAGPRGRPRAGRRPRAATRRVPRAEPGERERDRRRRPLPRPTAEGPRAQPAAATPAPPAPVSAPVAPAPAPAPVPAGGSPAEFAP